MSAKITKRQQAVLSCIEDCIREKGYGPTVREVCSALGLSSPSTVHVHLNALESKGLIKRDPLKSRSIVLTYPLDEEEPIEETVMPGINDGDYVVVKSQPVANNGDIVVAMIDDGATVKRFFKEQNYIRLQPENSSMEPIITTDCTIAGKVVAVFRRI